MSESNSDSVLKSCPFCGSDDIAIHFIRDRVSVGCRTEHCMGQWWHTRAYNNKEMAVEAWNTRKQSE